MMTVNLVLEICHLVVAIVGLDLRRTRFEVLGPLADATFGIGFLAAVRLAVAILVVPRAYDRMRFRAGQVLSIWAVPRKTLCQSAWGAKCRCGDQVGMREAYPAPSREVANHRGQRHGLLRRAVSPATRYHGLRGRRGKSLPRFVFVCVCVIPPASHSAGVQNPFSRNTRLAESLSWAGIPR